MISMPEWNSSTPIPDVVRRTCRIFAEGTVVETIQRTKGRISYTLSCSCRDFRRSGVGECAHLQVVLDNRNDVVQADGVKDALAEEGFIIVPVFVKPASLHIPVRFYEPQEPTNFRQVSLFYEDKLVVCLGLLPNYSSRLEIRELFIEWLGSDWLIRGNEMHCDAPQHVAGGSPHENPDRFTVEGSPTQRLLLDHYMLSVTGMCLSCSQDFVSDPY